MSEQLEAGAVPRWDIADRMRKALRESGVSAGEMARYLGVDRSSVSNWMNGRVAPSVQTVRLWALKTGVPYSWLCHGNDGPCNGGSGKSPGQRPVRWEHSPCNLPGVGLTGAVA